MGAGGVPNRAVENIYGKRGDLPTKGAKPNSRYDLYFEGIRIQSRWFDSNGCVVRNRDYDHQNAHNNHFSRTTIIGCGKTGCRIEFPIS